MKMKSKFCAVLLTVLLILSLLAACGQSGAGTQTTAATTAAATTTAAAAETTATAAATTTAAAAAATTTAAATTAAAAATSAQSGGGAVPAIISQLDPKYTEFKYVLPDGADISKEVALTMYVLGDIPSELDLVYDEVNKALKDVLNATVTCKYLSWGEWNEKYSLILASGDDVDLMYTSDWARYSTESAKGAFLELTDEFMAQYMPNMLKTQDPASIKQATINGKLYAIPKNTAGLEGENWVMIRKDLADKYGMTNIDSIEKLEEYYIAVLENESGILPYAASEGGGFGSTAWIQPQRLTSLTNIDWYYSNNGSPNAPDFSEISYAYFRDDAIPYYELMRKWEELGFWSKNAISNKDQVRDSFENGKSASLTWNATIFKAGRNLRDNNPDWDFLALDINPGTPRRQALYTNDAIAIADASPNPERAAMFIDLVKSDIDFYFMICGGIKDKHYIIDAEGKRDFGPDADKYPWTPSLWCFNWLDANYPLDASMMQEEIDFTEEQLKLILAPDTMAFRFDVEPVKNEMAAVNALRDEYRPMLELGMNENVVQTVAEWKSKAEAAGLNVIHAEIERQYNAWKSSL